MDILNRINPPRVRNVNAVFTCKGFPVRFIWKPLYLITGLRRINASPFLASILT